VCLTGSRAPRPAGHEYLTLDDATAALALQSLECLCHMFSWIPLEAATAHAPASLLTKLFHFATLGCRRGSVGQSAVAEAAMCCVNELLSKNRVPSPTCQQFILALFVHTFSLLKSLVHVSDNADQLLMLVRFDQLSHRSIFLYLMNDVFRRRTFLYLAYHKFTL